MRVLAGVIYGGRQEMYAGVRFGMARNTSVPFSYVLGANKMDDVVREEQRNGVFTLYYGQNIGHFQMANLMAEIAIAGRYNVMIDVNDDVLVVKKDWIARIVEEFEKDPNVGLVTFRECVVNPLDVNEDWTGKEFASAIFAARTAYIAENGLFDPRFFWYCGDSDMGWTCNHAGWKIRVIEEGWIQHKFRCGRDLKLDGGVDACASTDGIRLDEKWKGKVGKI